MGVKMVQFAKITILAAAAMLLSCGKADPLADQPDWVKKAGPGMRKGERTLEEKDWIINAENGASYFTFAEGVESQATIQPQMLVDGFKMEIYIENLDDFRDATFVQNGKDWIFTWKPPQNLVPSTSPLDMKLMVAIAARDPQKNTVLIKRREFPVWVTANRGAPVFIKDENFPTGKVRESESRTFYVYVRDTDPIGSASTAPQLRFEPATSSSTFGAVDVSAFLEVGRTTQEPTDPAVWKYQVTLNLGGRNFTQTESQGVFRMRAVSKSNIQSPARDYSFTILTGVSAPNVDFSTGERVRVVRGNRLTKVVNFIDPHSKGLMKAFADTATLPPGMTVDCKTNVTMTYFASCTLNWDVPATQSPAEYRISLRGENSSQAPGDNRKVDQKVDVRVEVTL